MIQMDVKTTFVHKDLKREICMEMLIFLSNVVVAPLLFTILQYFCHLFIIIEIMIFQSKKVVLQTQFE